MTRLVTRLSLAIAVLALAGCAATYNYNGKHFDNEQGFHAAIEADRVNSLEAIRPHATPLTKKRLIVALPSEQAIYDENARRHTALRGSPPMGIAVEQNRNLSKANHTIMMTMFQALQKRGVYPSIEIREQPTLAVSLEPSAEYDVMWYSEPSQGTGQYFYASAKHGRQVFAFDRSSPTVAGRNAAFVDAVQLLAIRD